MDLNICKDVKININLPVFINESEVFKYNPSGEYYNDLCYVYTTENGTDINLKDRKNNYLKKNMSVCESNCDFDKYDNYTKKVSCECEIKVKI